MMKLKRVCKTDPYLPAGSISEDDVISGIKQLKRKTACGSDTIQNYHLFFVCPKLVKCLTIYLSNAIGKADVPKARHNGLVGLLFKGDDKPKSYPDCYRPVYILSSLVKIFERIVLNRIQTFEVRLGTFPNPLQQRFQKKSWFYDLVFVFRTNSIRSIS
jgi:hypothetical protein